MSFKAVNPYTKKDEDIISELENMYFQINHNNHNITDSNDSTKLSNKCTHLITKLYNYFKHIELMLKVMLLDLYEFSISSNKNIINNIKNMHNELTSFLYEISKNSKNFDNQYYDELNEIIKKNLNMSAKLKSRNESYKKALKNFRLSHNRLKLRSKKLFDDALNYIIPSKYDPKKEIIFLNEFDEEILKIRRIKNSERKFNYKRTIYKSEGDVLNPKKSIYKRSTDKNLGFLYKPENFDNYLIFPSVVEMRSNQLTNNSPLNLYLGSLLFFPLLLFIYFIRKMF